MVCEWSGQARSRWPHALGPSAWSRDLPDGPFSALASRPQHLHHPDVTCGVPMAPAGDAHQPRHPAPSSSAATPASDFLHSIRSARETRSGALKQGAHLDKGTWLRCESGRQPLSPLQEACRGGPAGGGWPSMSELVLDLEASWARDPYTKPQPT